MVFYWTMLILIGMVVADFFVPMLPSATLVTSAAGFVVGEPRLIVVLLLCAAVSSWLGEVFGYQVFRAVRGGLVGRFAGRNWFLAKTVVRLESRLQGTLVSHPYRATMIARFLPAGRTALAWAAAGADRPPFVRMAALGAVLWAVYTVSLGLLIGLIAEPGWQSLLGSVTTVAAVGLVLGWAAKGWSKPPATEAPQSK